MEVYESAFALEWMEDPWQDVRAAGYWLLGLESEVRPDIVHLNHFAHGHLSFHAPVLIVGHSCVYSWYAAVHGCAPPEKWKTYLKAVRRGLRGADRVTAPTRAMLESLQFHYGQFNAAHPIFNCRAPSEFPPGKKAPLVMTAGRLWDEGKNAALLEKAAHRLSWPVEMAGACSHPDGSSTSFQQAKHLGRLNRTEMADCLKRASIFALPARYEPFGLSALEAGLAGCALVLGDIPSLREVWEDAAFYVHPEKEEELITAINRLIGDPMMLKRFAHRARSRALQFAPSRTVDAYLRLYAGMRRCRRAPVRKTAPVRAGQQAMGERVLYR